jgi:hypothetical protein
MTDPDLVKLLFGHYHAQPLKRGDRAWCEYRDCDVVVTGWTNGRIPWPLCRRVDPPGGHPGFLVEEELARAVRHESALAIQYWWGVCQKSVCRWSRALGVGRMDNEGTSRLVTAALEHATEEALKHEWTDEEREQRRQRAVEQGLGVLPPTCGNRRPDRWTPEQLALLGLMTDEELASRTGRTARAVRIMRTRLDIPTLLDRRLEANRD